MSLSFITSRCDGFKLIVACSESKMTTNGPSAWIHTITWSLAVIVLLRVLRIFIQFYDVMTLTRLMILIVISRRTLCQATLPSVWNYPRQNLATFLRLSRYTDGLIRWRMKKSYKYINSFFSVFQRLWNHRAIHSSNYVRCSQFTCCQMRNDFEFLFLFTHTYVSYMISRSCVHMRFDAAAAPSIRAWRKAIKNHCVHFECWNFIVFLYDC